MAPKSLAWCEQVMVSVAKCEQNFIWKSKQFWYIRVLIKNWVKMTLKVELIFNWINSMIPTNMCQQAQR
mgnify:CR=1 FL=1